MSTRRDPPRQPFTCARRLLVGLVTLAAAMKAGAARADEPGSTGAGRETEPTVVSAEVPARPGAAEPPGTRGGSAGSALGAGDAQQPVTERPGQLGRDAKAHTVRTLISTGLVLGVFSLGYWLSRRDKMAGWSYLDFEARVDEEAWRFDNNSLIVNYLLHPFSGGISYAAARADHHGIVASAGFSVLSSLLWEAVFEYRAKVSLNDMIVTPLTGVPIGEFMHKLGVYLDTSRSRRGGTRVAQWTLGTLVQLDRRIDGADHVVPRERDSLGMTRAIWHDFHFESDVSAASESGRISDDEREYARANVSMRGRLVSLPGYLRPGRVNRGFHRIDLTSLALGTEGSTHGMGFLAAADGLLAGHHVQDLHLTDAGTRGMAATTGVSMAFSYLDSRASSFREQLGALHLPGPALDWHLAAAPLFFSLRARAHPDFAGVSGLTYREWAAAHPRDRGKHILRNMGYYYAWGGSGTLAAELALGPLRAQGDLFYGRYRSQEGLNKWQERVTIDVPAVTELVTLRASVVVKPKEAPLALGVSGLVRRWDSWVGEFGGRAQLSSLGLQLSADF